MSQTDQSDISAKPTNPQTDPDPIRRKLLTSAAALAAASVLPGCGGGSEGAPKPNILFILVDEMRFPKVFPSGVGSAGEYIQTFMPNLFRLWNGGVKFSNYQVASTACSPSRGVMVTGLYSHQTWLCTTVVIKPGLKVALSPSLQPEFPTYGKLLRAAGYQTPYVGKWHLSQPAGLEMELDQYGFQGLTYPDPIGNNLQGTLGDMSNPDQLYYNDEYIADQAIAWLGGKNSSDQPWCLTVGFQNPHDQEFFPGGTESRLFKEGFLSTTANSGRYAQTQSWADTVCAAGQGADADVLANPPIYAGYPIIPPNWESSASLAESKPAAHRYNRTFCEAEWGGVSEDPLPQTFVVKGYPNAPAASNGTYTYSPPTDADGVPLGIGYAPYSYWNKAFNLYNYLHVILDRQIGRVLDAVSAEVLKNTVIVFTSDHGDYVGAHGMVAGKTMTMYDEALRIPLIVKDHTGAFTGDTDIVRTQLTSAVDLMPMLVGLGNGASRDWMQGDYAAMYSGRFDMFPLLKSDRAPGREYALFATDEVLPSKFDYVTAPDIDGQRTPVHIVGVISSGYKLGVYSKWLALTTKAWEIGREYEFYDYSTAEGIAELSNTYATTPAAALIKDSLLDVLVPRELEAPLPDTYRNAQFRAKSGLVAFNLLDQASGRE